jgi:hypothetical protein
MHIKSCFLLFLGLNTLGSFSRYYDHFFFFFFFFYKFFMMYVTEFVIGNYMCYFFHQLKQKQNTEWMLYKCTNTIPEQLLEQVMTILLKAQLHVTKPT